MPQCGYDKKRKAYKRARMPGGDKGYFMNTENSVSVEPGGDIGTVVTAQSVLSEDGAVPWYRRLLPFLGPAFIASVAYIDPGNFATNIEGGAKFGYTLVWVIVASNLTAMLIQTLSAKLGLATGRNLAEVCRDRFHPVVVWFMWGVMELVAMATDLAEFLGAALGFLLLFHLPLFWAGLLTAVVTFLVLGLQRYGFRPLEIIISVMVAVVALSYLFELVVGRPDWGGVGLAMISPGFGGSKEGVLLAVGILGATVMPHVIFLHSALMQGRIVVRDEARLKKLYHYEIIDVVLAMSIAGAVNAAMLIMAAATFHAHGMFEIGGIEEAYRTLTPLLGSGASVVFGISLLASGLSSSAVGTMAGQVVMQGFLDYHIPMWIRRSVTILPSLAVIAMGVDTTRALVMSQVVLSFGLPFAVIPLVIFTADAGLMGPLVNHKATTVAAWVTAVCIVLLNIYLLSTLISGQG